MIQTITSAIHKRISLTKSTNARRLINGQGDHCEGLVLEQYHQHFVAQVFDRSWLENLSLLTRAIQPFHPQYFIIKDRTGLKDAFPDAINVKVLIDQGPGPQTIVHEHGIRFAVDLNDTLNTGLFLDMRANRRKIGLLCTGKRVLNCFSYTCSFGVHARMNKATEVVNVDVSKKILDRGRINYGLNGIVPSAGEFIKADVVEYLQKAVKKSNRFDVIIIDPPSFARSAKGNFQIKRDLPNLLTNATQILNPEGILFVSTNYTEITQNDLKKMLDPKLHIQHILTQDQDFPATNTFKESYLTGLIAKIPERF